MPGDSRSAMPPVRLGSEAELARDALTVPLVARAARLARWVDAANGVAVGAGREPVAARLPEAVQALELDPDEEATDQTLDAWHLALDLGLVEVTEQARPGPHGDPDGAGEQAEDPDGAPDADGRRLPPDTTAGTATAGAELARLTRGSPADVLELWRGGVAAVLSDAATFDVEDLLDDLTESAAAGGDGIDSGTLERYVARESDFLEGALGNLYLLTATDAAVAAGEMVPLPALAASLIVPEDMDEPSDDALEEVSLAMTRLDEQFRLLETIGLVEYGPMDEALLAEPEPAPTGGGSDDGSGGEGAAAAGAPGAASRSPDEEDVSRYGLVRLTPLGMYGLRQRMLEAGLPAPAVGDLADQGADVLLSTLPGHPGDAARAETEQWLAGREPLAAARDLLGAARGDDRTAPQRRLFCQQALSLLGREAEPAVREVLDDPQLGGLARVWLTEHGAAEVPAPAEDMVFWLTVDTLAAQLASDGDSPELRELVQGLVDRHTGFFEKVWRVDHPAAGDVLEAMGRVHPDRRTAKEARKAAFRARSRGGG